MKVFVGITGASGSIYGVTLLKKLSECGVDILLTSTVQGEKVCQFETGIDIKELSQELKASYYEIDDLFAPPSSGSFQLDAVVIIPCSMGTLSRVANGSSSNLLERACDVALKERRKLILSPRESPLNSIHIENMLKLSQMGTIIAPPSIPFYNKPGSLDDIVNFQVGRVLDLLGLSHTLFNRWGVD